MQQIVSDSTAIHLKNLQFSYDNSKSRNILNIANWQVEKGERIFLHGRSGSGKSTLLNLLAGILRIKHGELYIYGHALHQLSGRQRDAFRARHIGLVFQQFNLIPYLTVRENIVLASHFSTLSSHSLQQRLDELFAGLQLDLALLHRRADALSVGQQQRVAIARALIHHPQLLIVDEPTSALDMEARDSFMQMLLNLPGQAERSLVFVSHDPTLAGYFSRSVEMQALNQEAVTDAV